MGQHDAYKLFRKKKRIHSELQERANKDKRSVFFEFDYFIKTY